MTALQRSSASFAAAASTSAKGGPAVSPQKEAPASAAAKKPADAKAAAAKKFETPELTTKAGASATGGDTVVDKIVLVAALGAVVTWWMTVKGPQHQH